MTSYSKWCPRNVWPANFQKQEKFVRHENLQEHLLQVPQIKPLAPSGNGTLLQSMTMQDFPSASYEN